MRSRVSTAHVSAYCKWTCALVCHRRAQHLCGRPARPVSHALVERDVRWYALYCQFAPTLVSAPSVEIRSSVPYHQGSHRKACNACCLQRAQHRWEAHGLRATAHIARACRSVHCPVHPEIQVLWATWAPPGPSGRGSGRGQDVRTREKGRFAENECPTRPNHRGGLRNGSQRTPAVLIHQARLVLLPARAGEVEESTQCSARFRQPTLGQGRPRLGCLTGSGATEATRTASQSIRKNRGNVASSIFLITRLPLMSASGRKAALRLSEADVGQVPKGKCRCRPAGDCLARIELEEVRTCRKAYWSLPTERERLAWLQRERQEVRARVLQASHRQRTETSWNVHGKRICTEAWLKLHGISFGKFAKAGSSKRPRREERNQLLRPPLEPPSSHRRKSFNPQRWLGFPDERGGAPIAAPARSGCPDAGRR